jgi:hypothetical protein
MSENQELTLRGSSDDADINTLRNCLQGLTPALLQEYLHRLETRQSEVRGMHVASV